MVLGYEEMGLEFGNHWGFVIALGMAMVLWREGDDGLGHSFA